MNVDKLLMDIIESKYEELGLNQQQEGQFYKIKYFEGNAIGQIGEKFVKQLFTNNSLPLDDNREVVHDEYDCLSCGKKIEIKTARKGLKNNTFQFNGINPSYNHDYIILIGLTSNKAYYLILDGHATYKHRERKYYLNVNGSLKQLVSMNPGNSVNYKLTLTLDQLKPISTLVSELKSLFGKNN